VVFVIVLAVVGTFVLRDAYRMFQQEKAAGAEAPHEASRLARWVQSVRIPGTMVYFPSIKAQVSLLFIVPLGFATGMLAATIAVGGFIGVPAMIYVLGAPALMATATELVIAFVMGLGGTVLYALDGVVDIRLAMIILAGSLFGIQIGAMVTKVVKGITIRGFYAMAVLAGFVNRAFALPGKLAEMELIPLPKQAGVILDKIGIWAFFVVIGLFAVWVIGTFLRNLKVLRGEEDAA